jgi:hypothetical protein
LRERWTYRASTHAADARMQVLRIPCLFVTEDA